MVRLPALLLVLAALLTGCQGKAHSRGAPVDSRPPEFVIHDTPHCRFQIETSISLSEGAQTRLDDEAESAYAAISAEWGPPRYLPVPITIRAGEVRCHTDLNGITIAQHHLPRYDITHEMVHYIAGVSWRPVNEGLATWITERLRHPPDDPSAVPSDLYSRAFAAAGVEVPLDSESCEANMDFRSYVCGASFVKWLIETDGLPRFRQLYRGRPDDYPTVYARTLETLVREWKAALAAQSKYDDDPRYQRLMSRLRGEAGPGTKREE